MKNVGTFFTSIFLLRFIGTAGEMDGIPPNSPIPAFLTNSQDCPLNACEVLRLISQHFLIVNSIKVKNLVFRRAKPLNFIYISREQTKESK